MVEKKAAVLNIVVHDASAMQEMNGGEKAMEPFTSFRLRNLDRDQIREVFPTNSRSLATKYLRN